MNYTHLEPIMHVLAPLFDRPHETVPGGPRDCRGSLDTRALAQTLDTLSHLLHAVSVGVGVRVCMWVCVGGWDRVCVWVCG